MNLIKRLVAEFLLLLWSWHLESYVLTEFIKVSECRISASFVDLTSKNSYLTWRNLLKRLVAEFLQPPSILCLKRTLVYGVAYSCAGKCKVFSSELMLLSLRIIYLKGSCFWRCKNIEVYTTNFKFGKTHFSLERVSNNNPLYLC